MYIMSQKSKECTYSSWVDHVSLSIISIFARESGLDGAFLDVGPYLDWGVLTLGENE